MRISLLAHVLLITVSASARAELVIDAFNQGRGLSNGTTMNGGVPLGSTAVDNLNAGIGGTRTSTITGSGTDWREGGYVNSPSNFLNLAPKQSVLRNNVGAGSLKLDYNFATDFDFTNTGQYVLQISLFQGVTPPGTWSYTVTIADGGTATSRSGSVVGGAPPGGVLTLRASDFGPVGLAIASTIDRLTVIVSGPNGGTLSRTNSGTGARIVANPEPASIILLGLTGVGGVLVARRRKKSEQDA